MNTLPGWRAALEDFIAELRGLYGSRLHHVVIYGSHAREDADPQSDIDTLVVLDPGGEFWAEFARISPVASRVSLTHDVVVSAIPVALSELRDPTSPLLRNARREGVPVA